jgi:hypothetical protein
LLLPAVTAFRKRSSLVNVYEQEFYFLMPPRKTAPSLSAAASTRPQRAAATKAADAIKSAAKKAAPPAKTLTKAVSKKRSQTSKAKTIRSSPAKTKKGKDAEDGVSAAAYAKEFRSLISLDQAMFKFALIYSAGPLLLPSPNELYLASKPMATRRAIHKCRRARQSRWPPSHCQSA